MRQCNDDNDDDNEFMECRKKYTSHTRWHDCDNVLARARDSYCTRGPGQAGCDNVSVNVSVSWMNLDEWRNR
jgi:hypothetical protein